MIPQFQVTCRPTRRGTLHLTTHMKKIHMVLQSHLHHQPYRLLHDTQDITDMHHHQRVVHSLHYKSPLQIMAAVCPHYDIRPIQIVRRFVRPLQCRLDSVRVEMRRRGGRTKKRHQGHLYRADRVAGLSSLLLQMIVSCVKLVVTKIYSR